MLSFELSVVDVVLAIAIIIVLLLHITRTPTKNTAEAKILREKRIPIEESRKNTVMPKTSKKKESASTRSQEGLLECPHHFGYLKTLPDRSSIPEECYSCSRMMQCLFSADK